MSNRSDHVFGLLEQCSSTNIERDSKRQRASCPNLPPLFRLDQAIHGTLCSFRDRLMANSAIDLSKIEIELRLGMFVTNESRWRIPHSSNNLQQASACIVDDSTRSSNRIEFKAGLDLSFVHHHLQGVLNDVKKFRELLKSPTQRTRGSGDYMNAKRWVVGEHDKIISMESKQKLFREDISLLSHEYDIRIGVALETRIEGIPRGFDPLGWTVERRKRRKSYVLNAEHHSIWKIDYTEVDVINRKLGPNNTFEITNSSTEYELELELQPEVQAQWLVALTSSETNNKIAELTVQISKSLLHLINILIPSDVSVNPLVLSQLNPTSGAEHNLSFKTQIESINRDIISQSHASDFIGSQPYNMSRNAFTHIKGNNYFMTEKSDGTRYLLYVLLDPRRSPFVPIAVAVNRSNEIFELKGSHLLGFHLRKGTVLDGELVFNLHHRFHMFLAFDVLAVDGTQRANLIFEKRLELLEGIVKSRIEGYLKANGSAGGSGIIVNRKKYSRKCDISILLSNISMQDGGRVYREPDGRRHHKTDGIIFQPDSPYRPKSDEYLLKWKFPELRTVDLLVKIEQRTVRLYCDANSTGETIDCTKRGGLGVFDTYRLLGDIGVGTEAYAHNKIHIAEVMFDSAVGQWKYHRLRDDKNRPNNIQVVLSTFVEQSENISIEELEYELMQHEGDGDGSTARPSFSDCLLVTMKQIVDNARKK